MQFQFASAAEFFSMGGHGAFVWIAYAVTFAAMTGLAIQPYLGRRRLERELARQQRIQAHRQSRVPPHTNTVAE
ncbi:heme exporter protein CcmD [Microbulbifer sp. TYP-18]|uniref:heme exporter protein CcmD n=1 Tax=Microbulbifer sp. TYP-18 TaxID=3230024 RepID=UPI0034C6D56B